MRLIIAGGQDYKFTQDDINRLDDLDHKQEEIGDPIIEVVSGCATGADKYGEAWAHSREIFVMPFPAQWKVHGRAAGPIRNRKMAEYADAVVLFPGGKGTDSMFDEAKKAGIKIFDWRPYDLFK